MDKNDDLIKLAKRKLHTDGATRLIIITIVMSKVKVNYTEFLWHNILVLSVSFQQQESKNLLRSEWFFEVLMKYCRDSPFIILLDDLSAVHLKRLIMTCHLNL